MEEGVYGLVQRKVATQTEGKNLDDDDKEDLVGEFCSCNEVFETSGRCGCRRR